jgi:hypothetical protein
MFADSQKADSRSSPMLFQVMPAESHAFFHSFSWTKGPMDATMSSLHGDFLASKKGTQNPIQTLGKC